MTWHRNTVIPLALILLLFASTGCVTSKKKHDRLVIESDNLREQFRIARDENGRLIEENASLSSQLLDAQQLAQQAAESAAAQMAVAQEAVPEQTIEGARITESEGITTITVSNEIMFASGKADISSSGKKVLQRVAELLKTTYSDGAIRVEGHTDDQPIVKTKDLYKSNWELSTARALAVVHYLVDSCGIDPERIHPAGYSKYHPVASNASASGRAQNRRVEIVVLQGLSR